MPKQRGNPISEFREQQAMNMYQEAVILASIAWEKLVTIGVNDPLFLRYFQRDDYEFVKGITTSAHPNLCTR